MIRTGGVSFKPCATSSVLAYGSGIDLDGAETATDTQPVRVGSRATLGSVALGSLVIVTVSACGGSSGKSASAIRSCLRAHGATIVEDYHPTPPLTFVGVRVGANLSLIDVYVAPADVGLLRETVTRGGRGNAEAHGDVLIAWSNPSNVGVDLVRHCVT